MQRRIKLVLIGFCSVAVIAMIAVAVLSHVMRKAVIAEAVSSDSHLMIINTAAITYRDMHHNFPATLAALGAEGLIDSVLASGKKSGYIYRYQAHEGKRNGIYDGYEVAADPIDLSKHGQPHYFTDESGVIRMEIDHPATVQSQPISNR